MRLRQYQIDILNDRSRLILVGAARQTGKDIIIQELLNQSNIKESVVFFPNDAQRTQFIEGFKKHIYAIDGKMETRIKMRESAPWIHLRLIGPNADAQVYRGSSFEKVIFSEPAYVTNNQFILDMVEHLPDISKNAYFIGTPRPQDKQRYDAFHILYLFRKQLGFKLYNIDASEVAKEEFIKKARETYTDSLLTTDILGRFE
jgi:hypothetical protein